MRRGVSVLIPYRSTCASRAAVLFWLRAALGKRYPTWQLVDDHDGTATGSWCKAKAIDRCIAQATGDVLVVHDADVWVEPPHLLVAVELVEGGVPWVVPHTWVHRLTAEATAGWLADAPTEALEEPAYRGTVGGGAVVLTRAAYAAAPMDPRFTGWGGEDEAWGMALGTLAGQLTQLDGVLWHLWHPKAARLTRGFGSLANETLRRRYWRANANRGRMEELLAAR